MLLKPSSVEHGFIYFFVWGLSLSCDFGISFFMLQINSLARHQSKPKTHNGKHKFQHHFYFYWFVFMFVGVTLLISIVTRHYSNSTWQKCNKITTCTCLIFMNIVKHVDGKQDFYLWWIFIISWRLFFRRIILRQMLPFSNFSKRICQEYAQKILKLACFNYTLFKQVVNM